MFNVCGQGTFGKLHNLDESVEPKLSNFIHSFIHPSTHIHTHTHLSVYFPSIEQDQNEHGEKKGSMVGTIYIVPSNFSTKPNLENAFLVAC
jgi:hypothetical protein